MSKYPEVPFNINLAHKSVVLCWYESFGSLAQKYDFIYGPPEITELSNLILEGKRFYIGYCDGYVHDFTLTNIWDRLFLYAEYDDERELNGIPYFSDGQFYLAISDDMDQNFERLDFEFEFPAVFYSKEEMLGWSLWNLLYWFPFLVNGSAVLSDINSRQEYKVALENLKKKLVGELSWSFGPARKYEPNRREWEKIAGDKNLNAEILSRFL